MAARVESMDVRLGILAEAQETARQENRAQFAEHRAILEDIRTEFRRLNGTVASHDGRITTLEGEMFPLHAEQVARIAVQGFLSSIKGRIIAGLAIGGGVLTITSAAVMLAQTIMRDWP